MATITNTTRKTLAVSLPGGKKLRLGPLKSGEIADKAIDHPAVQKLIEAGDVEVSGSRESPKHGGGGKGSPATSGGKGHGGAIRQSGDR